MRFTQEQAERANTLTRNTLVEHLGITFQVDEHGHFTGTMPVDQRTKQPMGLLHGGATAALAESLGSMGSALLVDLERQGVVGTSLTVNHLKGVRSGSVLATGELLHHGRSTHVWDIHVTNAEGLLCAVCRLTNMIIDRA